MAEANDGPTTQAHRAEAAVLRKALHRSVARRDLEDLRKALHDLYANETSPLKQMGDIKRVETYAPMVEAAILACVYAPETMLHKEMLLNLKHTHAKFHVPDDQYEKILTQLESLQMQGIDAHTVDWCADTCLHDIVKPFRHIQLFKNGSGTAPSN